MPQSVARLDRILVLIRCKPGFKSCIVGHFRRDAFGDKFHLLRDEPPHDRIVEIQPSCPALAVQNLFAHPLVDQPSQFVSRRRALPDALEFCLQAVKLPLGNDDFARCT